MAIVIARTRNSTYVIDTDETRVECYGADGRRAWVLDVSAVMSVRPLSEADAHSFEEGAIRGPLGQALVPMPETAWQPVAGRTMVLQARDGGRILTTPVISVTGSMARAA